MITQVQDLGVSWGARSGDNVVVCHVRIKRFCLQHF